MENEQTPVTTPEAVVTTPDPNAPSGQPVNSAGRDAIIQKYEQQYFTPEPEAVAPAPTIETPTPEPTAATTPDPMAAVMAELAYLREQLAPKQPEPQVQAPVTQEDWLKLLSEGKKSEGERALAEVLGPQIQEQAVQKALALMQAERAVTEYNNEVRQKHADLLPMEEYIAMGANARIQEAQASGRIKSPADYVTVYKEAITAEIEKARKLTQSLQGAGAQRATTRVSEVVASQTLRPNPVNTQREQTQTPTEPQVESMSDYFAKRKQQHAVFSGLSTAQGR